MKKLILIFTPLLLVGCTQSSVEMELPAAIDLTTDSVESTLPEQGDSTGPDLSDGVENPRIENEPSGEQSEAESPQTDNSTNEEVSSETPSSSEFAFDDAELEIEDQRGDGTSVLIDEVRTNLQAGLIVIFDISGNYLGSAPVSASVQPVSIQLESPVTRSQELIGQLFADNGNGIFDSSDLPVSEPEEDQSDEEAIYEDFEYEVN